MDNKALNYLALARKGGRAELGEEPVGAAARALKEAANMQKKIPQRQCMGCRERKPKRELIRVVRSPEGNVSLDFGGKMNGRGAYVCPDPECLKKAVRSKALDRSLEVTIPEDVYARLEKEMEGSHHG